MGLGEGLLVVLYLLVGWVLLWVMWWWWRRDSKPKGKGPRRK
ncbi:hypothetical protein [Micromonospora sp. DT233]